MLCFTLATSSYTQKAPGELDFRAQTRGNCQPTLRCIRLVRGGSADEEPLVNARVNGRRSVVLAPWDVELARIGTIGGVSDGDVGPTAPLVLSNTCSMNRAYSEISPLWVLPVMSLSQASAHSRTISVAYLLLVSTVVNIRRKNTHFLFLHSPEKANWFSGFPSGIL